MCNYFVAGVQMPELERVTSAILGSVDWKALREALARMRNQSGLTLDGLAEASGIDRTTIHRIENTKKRIKHNPDLETIERLVCGAGQTLSGFFRQIEPGQPLQIDSASEAPTKAVSGDSSSPQALPPTIALTPAQLQVLIRSLVAARRNPRQHRSDDRHTAKHGRRTAQQRTDSRAGRQGDVLRRAKSRQRKR